MTLPFSKTAGAAGRMVWRPGDIASQRTFEADVDEEFRYAGATAQALPARLLASRAEVLDFADTTAD
ncbi:hypothetical protein GCM10009846_26440 [Agrococcus versicolor]|uniref:Uncharacterized protein n=1 Tax=Agrococcus versicolor TaxID=501482 RepID=A0ABP5MM96_9MICO